jgi:hypothetical protein
MPDARDETDDGTMKVVPNGKWQWEGVFVPEGSDDPEESAQFITFADTMEQAVADSVSTLPPGSEIVYLRRGRDVSEEGFDIPKEVADKLRDAVKRQVN